MTDPGTPALTADDVAASLARGDGGFGRNQATYFDHPVLRKAHWDWKITWYFYIGGIASGSAILSVLADRRGEPEDRALVRNGRAIAFFGSLASGVLLIMDLGRPERFLNMLRIVKLKSPMSVGVYALSAFSTFAGLGFADELARARVLPFNPARLLPAWFRDPAYAGSAALLGSYTGVLISATAIPVWFSGRWHLPAIFVSSATATACALNSALLALEPKPESRHAIDQLERLEAFASAVEGVLLLDYRRQSGVRGNSFFEGAIGKKVIQRTMVSGIILPLVLNMRSIVRKRPARSSRLRTISAAVLTLVGGYFLRETIMDAGKLSGDDARAYIGPG